MDINNNKIKDTRHASNFTQEEKDSVKQLYGDLKTGDVIKCWVKATSVDKNYETDPYMQGDVYVPVLYVVYDGPKFKKSEECAKPLIVFKINTKRQCEYQCELSKEKYGKLHNDKSYVSLVGQSLQSDDIMQMEKIGKHLSLSTLKSMACALTKFAVENDRSADDKKAEHNELEQLKYELKSRTARMDCQFLNDYAEKAELKQKIKQQQDDLDRKEQIIQEKMAEIRALKAQLNEERARNNGNEQNRHRLERSREREIEQERFSNINNDFRYNNNRREYGYRYGSGQEQSRNDNNNFRYNDNYRHSMGGFNRGNLQMQLNNRGSQNNQYLHRQSNNDYSQYNQYQGRGLGGRGG